MHNYLIFFSSPRIPLIWTKNALSTASLHSFTAGSALDFHSPINHTDSQRQLTVAGGLLEASMMILDTVRRMAQRTRKIHKSCYFNELRAKSVASITGCGQTFTPPVGSPHQSDGSFPTNASLSVPSKGATGVYLAPFDGSYARSHVYFSLTNRIRNRGRQKNG